MEYLTNFYNWLLLASLDAAQSVLPLLIDYYNWLLAGHLIAVIFWMAGMYWLPRLFAYHAEAAATGAPVEIFARAAHSLLRIIMNPSMIAAWIFGLALILRPGVWQHATAWLDIKLGLVVFLSAFHGYLAAERKKIAAGTIRHSPKFYRTINEIPPVLTIIIVILVVVRPL